MRSVVTFPVEARKIKDVTAEVRDLQATPVEDKVIVEGVFHKQIGWVANVSAEVGGISYIEDAVYELPVDERFTTFVELPGATPDSVIDVDARVEFVDHTNIPDTVTDGDEWQQTVILEIHVRATETMELEVITDVKAPPGLKLKITKEKVKVEDVLGEAEKQVNIMSNINLPAGVQAAKKKYHSGSAQYHHRGAAQQNHRPGILHKQIFYIDAETRQMFEFSLDEDFTTFVHLPGVEPKTDVTVKAMLELSR